MKYIFYVAAILLGITNLAAADDSNRPKLVTLSITPAAEANPALKYQLLPAIHERKPGNAAQFYYRALLNIKGTHHAEHWKEYAKNHERWSEPIDKLPVEEIRKWLSVFETPLQEVRTATYREHCDWDWRLEDTKGLELFTFLLEEVQSARDIARILALKARVEIKEGKFDEALLTLRDGYQLAVNVTSEPLIINGLVGVAISAVLNEVVIDWIAQPNSPNLFWAATALPSPLIDMRPALVFEAGACDRVLSFMHDAETAQRTPEEWMKLISEQVDKMHRLTGSSPPTPLEKAGLLAAVPGAYSKAKRELIAAGYDEKKLEAMPVGQVLTIQSRRATIYASHEILKQALIDSPNVADRMTATEERLRREGWLAKPLMGKDPFGVAGLILPALGNVTLASHRLQRNVAAIQAIEAIRMHAADKGSLPASLDEIKIVPVPLNPATGKPFPYKADDKTATFELPQVRDWQDGAIYTINLVK